MSEINHKYTSEIVCPYCGYQYSDSWESCGDSESDVEMECPKCGKEFCANAEITVEYSTTKKPCADDKHEMVLDDNIRDGSYIYDGRNWTIYKCKLCDEKIIKTGQIAADGKPYIIPVDAEEAKP